MMKTAQARIPVTKVILQEISMIGTCLINVQESCYHRIKCTTTTFLAAFMWRRPLNSATSANATHRKLKRVSDGTGTQVRAQMINKCKIKMVQRGLYNVKDPLWERGEKNCKQICNRALTIKYLRISVLGIHFIRPLFISLSIGNPDNYLLLLGQFSCPGQRPKTQHIILGLYPYIIYYQSKYKLIFV